MQRYGKICTNTRKRTKKFTLSLFLARFFATITVTTPLALGYHPEDARRVKDVLGISSVLRCRYIYCFCIPLVYPWYTSGIALPICPSSDPPSSPSFPPKQARASLPAPKHNSELKFIIILHLLSHHAIGLAITKDEELTIAEEFLHIAAIYFCIFY